MPRGKTIHFLITYDRSNRQLLNLERFHNGKKAVDTYGERGARVRGPAADRGRVARRRFRGCHPRDPSRLLPDRAVVDGADRRPTEHRRRGRRRLRRLRGISWLELAGELRIVIHAMALRPAF